MMYQQICTYIRDFIVIETETDFHYYSSEIDWKLEDLWVRDYLDDGETINDFGYQGFIAELERLFDEENSYEQLVEKANSFIMSLLQVYYDDQEEEMNQVVHCWNEKYRLGFQKQVLDLYFKTKEKDEHLVRQFQNQKI